jgi:hypothetical protein
MGGVRGAASGILALEGLSARMSPQVLSILSQLLLFDTVDSLKLFYETQKLSILSQLLRRIVVEVEGGATVVFTPPFNSFPVAAGCRWWRWRSPPGSRFQFFPSCCREDVLR